MFSSRSFEVGNATAFLIGLLECAFSRGYSRGGMQEWNAIGPLARVLFF